MTSISDLKQQQKQAFDALCAFFNSPKDRFFRLSGFAGTGKTFLIGLMVNQFPHKYQLGTAPTNKAAKALSRSIGKKCKTIFSALGIIMEADEDRLVLKFPHKMVNLDRWDVIWVDEASMTNEMLVAYICKVADAHRHLKWVFSADRAQLNPVGESESPIWRMDIPNIELTEVVRYDNQILNLATHIREQIVNFPNYDLRVVSDHLNKEGVWKYKRAAFDRAILRAAKQGYFHEIDHTKLLAWRNKTVCELNDIVRYDTFGRHAYHEPLITGDRLMVASPVVLEGHIIANIDDEGSVTAVSLGHNPVYKQLKSYNLVVKLDYAETIDLCLIHEDSETELANLLNKLASEARKDHKKWGAFWMLKNEFHKIRYSYALTSHRVQGSTLKYAMVDKSDIFVNRDKLEALRSFYVSCTRPTTGLVIS